MDSLFKDLLVKVKFLPDSSDFQPPDLSKSNQEAAKFRKLMGEATKEAQEFNGILGRGLRLLKQMGEAASKIKIGGMNDAKKALGDLGTPDGARILGDELGGIGRHLLENGGFGKDRQTRQQYFDKVGGLQDMISMSGKHGAAASMAADLLLYYPRQQQRQAEAYEDASSVRHDRMQKTFELQHRGRRGGRMRSFQRSVEGTMMGFRGDKADSLNRLFSSTLSDSQLHDDFADKKTDALRKQQMIMKAQQQLLRENIRSEQAANREKLRGLQIEKDKLEAIKEQRAMLRAEAQGSASTIGRLDTTERKRLGKILSKRQSGQSLSQRELEFLESAGGSMGADIADKDFQRRGRQFGGILGQLQQQSGFSQRAKNVEKAASSIKKSADQIDKEIEKVVDAQKELNEKLLQGLKDLTIQYNRVSDELARIREANYVG